jgi:hypothetical protein
MSARGMMFGTQEGACVMSLGSSCTNIGGKRAALTMQYDVGERVVGECIIGCSVCLAVVTGAREKQL